MSAIIKHSCDPEHVRLLNDQVSFSTEFAAGFYKNILTQGDYQPIDAVAQTLCVYKLSMPYKRKP